MLMQQMKGMRNPEMMIMNLLQQNPQLQSIIPLLRNGNNLEGIAQQMAKENNINMNTLLSQLNI